MLIAAAKNESVLARAKIDMLLWWIWYFAKNYESLAEVNFLITLLTFYLNDDQEDHFSVLGDEFRGKLREWVTKCMDDKHRTYDAHFLGMTLGFVTTEINESYHRATKYNPKGPKLSDNLHKSAVVISEIKDERK